MKDNLSTMELLAPVFGTPMIFQSVEAIAEGIQEGDPHKAALGAAGGIVGGIMVETMRRTAWMREDRSNR